MTTSNSKIFTATSKNCHHLSSFLYVLKWKYINKHMEKYYKNMHTRFYFALCLEIVFQLAELNSFGKLDESSTFCEFDQVLRLISISNVAAFKSERKVKQI